MGLRLICTYTGLSTAESGVKGLYGDCKSKGALAEVRVRFVNTSTEQLVSGSPAARYERCSGKSMRHLNSDNALAQRNANIKIQTHTALPALQPSESQSFS